MMQLHRRFVDVRLQRRIVVGQGGKFVGHGRFSSKFLKSLFNLRCQPIRIGRRARIQQGHPYFDAVSLTRDADRIAGSLHTPSVLSAWPPHHNAAA
jgi:hypothetical protein